MSSYILEVNGQALESPASCTWGLYFMSSEESGRNTLNGDMHIDDIAQKRKLSGITWSYPTREQATAILQKFMAKRMMTIKYDDLLSGKIETRTFYMSDPTAQVHMWSANKKVYTQLAFDLIEK